jgi:hypothetical protein
MVLSLEGDHPLTSYLQTPFNERLGRFSVDGTKVAYVSDESGRDEVYVDSFPKPTRKMRISAAGGTTPEWGSDGELYFLQPARSGDPAMMLAATSGTGHAAPQRLFEVPGADATGNRPAFAVFDNGRRFLIKLLLPIVAPQVITIGQNWTTGLAGAR